MSIEEGINYCSLVVTGWLRMQHTRPLLFIAGVLKDGMVTVYRS